MFELDSKFVGICGILQPLELEGEWPNLYSATIIYSWDLDIFWGLDCGFTNDKQYKAYWPWAYNTMVGEIQMNIQLNESFATSPFVSAVTTLLKQAIP